MLLTELIKEKKTDSNIIVLSYGSDNDVVLHIEDLDMNSKFMRRSRIRLGVDLVPVEIADDTETEIYRTYRDRGHDYFVYIYKGDYKAFSGVYRKRVSNKRVKTEAKQISIKDIVPPNEDRTLNIILMSANTASMRVGLGEIKKYRMDLSDIYKPYKTTPKLIIKLLQMVAYSNAFNEIRIEVGDDILKNIMTDIYIPKTPWIKDFKTTFDKAVAYFGNKGIAVQVF